MGYQNKTGIHANDYLITDAVVDVPGTEQPYTEELARLPCLCCYQPFSVHNNIPDVAPLPALTKKHVSFGSFITTLMKVGPRCIALWARVLQEVPGSRLMIK